MEAVVAVPQGKAQEEAVEIGPRDHQTTTTRNLSREENVKN